MGFFDFFSDHGHSSSHHRHGGFGFNESDSHPEDEMVAKGRGVYAWIEKSGFSYNGEIPGVSWTSVRMARSFEECLDELTKKLNESSSVQFSSFRQKVSYEDIQDDHPNARIVFIAIRR